MIGLLDEVRVVEERCQMRWVCVFNVIECESKKVLRLSNGGEREMGEVVSRG